MEGYKGWTLYDEVTLVIKSEDNKYGYPQGYVVNTKDNKQLQSAINWGTYKKYKYDNNGNAIIKDDSHTYDVIEPKVITFKNNGFRLTLLDVAHNSCQGGKQSFWNCLIEKDDIKCVIGINSALLLVLLLQSTIINGKCQSELKFARCNGGVGLLHEGMIEYTEAISDMQAKKDIGKGKTSKWKIGCNYLTLTTDSTYLGDLYVPIIVEVRRKGCVYYNSDEIEIIIGKNKTPYRHIIADTKDIKDSINTFSKLFQYSRDNLTNEIRKLNSRDNKSNKYYNILLDSIKPFETSLYNIVGTFPSRKFDKQRLEIDVDIQEELDKLLRETKQYIKNSNDKIRFSPYDLTFITTCAHEKSFEELSEFELQLFNQILSDEYLKDYFGNCTVNISTMIDDIKVPGVHIDELLKK